MKKEVKVFDNGFIRTRCLKVNKFMAEMIKEVWSDEKKKWICMDSIYITYSDFEALKEIFNEEEK